MDTEIVGTIQFNPDDDRLLIYTVDPDTLPQNSLSPVESVINPTVKGPDSGLPAADAGQRYLIVENMSEQSSAWGTINANANDIIEYDGTQWNVVFDSRNATTVEFVTNVTSGVQYRFADGQWMKSYEGWYDEGDYSIVI